MKHLLTALAIVTATAAHAAPAVPLVPDSQETPLGICLQNGTAAQYIATLRTSGLGEYALNKAFSNVDADTQGQVDFRVRMLKAIYVVFHDYRYQRGIAPEAINDMIVNECEARIPASYAGDDE